MRPVNQWKFWVGSAVIIVVAAAPLAFLVVVGIYALIR